MSSAHELLRTLPSVDALVSSKAAEPLLVRHGHSQVVSAARAEISDIRLKITKGANTKIPDNESAWIKTISARLDLLAKPKVTRIINCTGVVIHTNLGRALLAQEAADAAHEAALSNINLEYRIDDGVRGDRDELTEELLQNLTGAEAACVVNNNAAAVFLVINTFSAGRECIISRGEQIEIGGSFRLPEVMVKSGCIVKEVGATNKTHLADYENAIGENTGLILKAHTSNYRVIGFTSAPELSDLATTASSKGVPLAVDLGSGTLIDLTRFGLPHEPTIQETYNAGAGIVTFSGDKLLGGPQAGIIVGQKKLIEAIDKNPIKRALRCDKVTLAALEQTLKLYLNPDEAIEKIPTLRYLARPINEIRKTAEEVAVLLSNYFDSIAEVSVINDVSQAGSGSLPEVDIPSHSVSIHHSQKSPNELARWFRGLAPPIVGRVESDIFRLDMRCIDSPVMIAESLPKTPA